MFFKLTYIMGLFQKKASLPHQHDLLQTQLQTHAGIMMMLGSKIWCSLLQVNTPDQTCWKSAILSVHVKW